MESYFSVDNIYRFSEQYVLGIGYYTTFVFVAYSFLKARQFRFDFVVAVEKLSVKRQFVRFVSHEVRTPLNSCVLGLEYLKNMCSGSGSGGQSSDDMLTVLDEILDSCTTVSATAMMNLLCA